MALTPADIEAHVFREKFKGYDPDEVDEFLDRVADRVAELIGERDRLSERVEKIQADAAESLEAERLLKRTLITAQRTADETVAEAREEAERTRAEAEAHAEQVREDAEQRASAALEDASRRAAATLDDAERRAAGMVAQAEERAAAIVAEAQREADANRDAAQAGLDRIRACVADLERFRAEYRDRVRDVVTEQLAALERAGEVPDVPDGLAELPRRAEEALQGGGDGGRREGRLGSMRRRQASPTEEQA